MEPTQGFGPFRLVLRHDDGREETRDGYTLDRPYTAGEQLTVDGECWQVVELNVEGNDWQLACEPC